MVKEAAEEVGVSDVVPEMVERVARAIVKAGGGDPDFTGYQSGPADDARPSWLRKAKIARAAIEAMRMTYGAGDAPDIIHAKRAWNAGIDAALTDTKTKGSETP